MEKVSIIIPAYNKAELTVKTVKSVLNQTYPHTEIIVVDDGSVDQTQKYLSEFKNRIQYVYKTNGGACSARNLGIRLAQGEFIGFLDCDDLYLENKVELCVDFLKRNPDYGFVHTAAFFIDREEKIVGFYFHPKSQKQGWIADRLILGNYICNSTVIVRKSCLQEVGFLDESIFMPADWDLWLRLAEKFKVGYINKPLTKYRITDNYTFKRIEECQEEEKIVLNKFFFRNQNSSSLYKNRVFSYFHLRYAQCYFIQDKHQRFKEEFWQTLKMYPLNVKALAHLLYYCLAKENLKSNLRKRILRYS